MSATAKEIAEAVVAAMLLSQARNGEDPGIYTGNNRRKGTDYPEAHNAFVAMWILREEKKVLRWNRLSERLMGTILIGAALGALGLVGAGALTWIKDHLK